MLRWSVLETGVVAAGALLAGLGSAQTLPRIKLGAAAADFHAARRFAKTRLGRIAYVAEGAGPAAIFLHGFPLNGSHWRCGARIRAARPFWQDCFARWRIRVSPVTWDAK